MRVHDTLSKSVLNCEVLSNDTFHIRFDSCRVCSYECQIALDVFRVRANVHCVVCNILRVHKTCPQGVLNGKVLSDDTLHIRLYAGGVGVDACYIGLDAGRVGIDSRLIGCDIVGV